MRLVGGVSWWVRAWVSLELRAWSLEGNSEERTCEGKSDPHFVWVFLMSLLGEAFWSCES